MPDVLTSISLWCLVGILVAIADDAVYRTGPQRDPVLQRHYQSLRPAIFVISAVVWPISLLFVIDMLMIRWTGRGLWIVEWFLDWYFDRR